MASSIAIRACPHCKAQNVAFTAKSEWELENSERRALFICGACREGVIWAWWGGSSVIQQGGNVDKRNLILGKQWPDEVSGDAPQDTPPTVANYFEQATASLASGHFDAAGMMFRKSLETATKILNADLAQRPLVKRIDALVESGGLTKDMGQWAHEVRLGGNEAAHEDEPFTLEQAEDLQNFIENFLRYAFTLPSAVRRRVKPAKSEA